MTKLYQNLFSPPQEQELLNWFSLRVVQYNWITETHLDLKFAVINNFEESKIELARLSLFRAPKDKLTIIINVCQMCVELIENIKNNTGNEEYSDNSTEPNGEISTIRTTSDLILPVLILLILKSNPPQLISHIKFVLRFRNDKELEKGVSQFALTTFVIFIIS